LCSQEQQVI